MNITLLGTSSAILTADRVNTSVIVETPDNLFLFDCGSGALQRIAQAGYDSAKISAVFLTHHHLDHNSDLMSLLKANWLKGKKEMKIYGPVGTKKLIERLLDVYAYLRGKFTLKIKELENNKKVRLGRDVVECVRVEHSAGALAYKLTSGGSSVVYSGDTEPCSSIARLSNGADLLIHECNFSSEDMRGIEGHSNPVSIGKTYADVDVKRIVLVHLSPGIDKSRAKILKAVKKNFKGNVIIGRDLFRLEP